MTPRPPLVRDRRARVIVPARPPGMRRRALHDDVIDLVRLLSQKHGVAYATEAGYRRVLYETTGYVCGLRSWGRAMKRLKARGEIGQERVKPYAVRVDGSRRHPGTTHAWIIARRDQRAARRRAKEEARQARHGQARQERERIAAEQRRREEEIRQRTERRQASVSLGALLVRHDAPAAEFVPPPPEQAALPLVDLQEQRRAEVQRQLALARERPDLWDDGDREREPPDK